MRKGGREGGGEGGRVNLPWAFASGKIVALRPLLLLQLLQLLLLRSRESRRRWCGGETGHRDPKKRSARKRGRESERINTISHIFCFFHTSVRVASCLHSLSPSFVVSLPHSPRTVTRASTHLLLHVLPPPGLSEMRATTTTTTSRAMKRLCCPLIAMRKEERGGGRGVCGC